jgi:hypothetical protein
MSRLDSATREMFGTGLDGDLVRAYIRHALAADIPAASVRVSVFQPDTDESPSVMVIIRPPVIAESSIGNIGFYDGTAVIWPDAPVLTGITMQLVTRALAERGMPSRLAPVRIADLSSFQAAFVTNSLGVVPVGQVDEEPLHADPKFTRALADANESVPWDRI